MRRQLKKHLTSKSAFPIVSVEDAAPIPLALTPEQEEANRWLKKQDMNDFAAGGGLETWLNHLNANARCIHRSNNRITSLRRLRTCYPHLKPPVIEGLLRRGETMNVIGASKTGKSALGLNVTMEIITGGALFGRFKCERGRVLVIDNELHCETLVYRNEMVAKAYNIPVESAEAMIDYIPLRGDLVDLLRLEEDLATIRPGQYITIILDAFYKMFPKDVDENSNADMANLYSVVDKYAEATQSAFILIHHTSKGLQGDREVTDVGAGAGAQSRASDTHLVLRPHEDEGVTVIDAVARSWPPIKAFCARFKYPRWELDDGADPEALKGRKKTQQQIIQTKADRQTHDADILENDVLPAINRPMTEAEILAVGNACGMARWSRRTCHEAVRRWLDNGAIVQIGERNGQNGATFQKTGQVGQARAAAPAAEPAPQTPPDPETQGEEPPPFEVGDEGGSDTAPSE